MNNLRGIGSDRTTLNEKQEVNAYRIGIVKKNQDLRNAILKRNIGRYDQYKEIMSPGIGEVENINSNEGKLPTSIGSLLNYTHGKDEDKTNLRQEIEKRYGEIFKQYYQTENLSNNASLPWKGNYNDYIDYMVKVHGVEGVNDGQFTLGDMYDAVVDVLKYTDASYMAKDMAVGVVRNINVPDAMNGVITTNVSNMSGEDTKLGVISNKAYSNTLYNAALVNNSRNRQYITNALGVFVGNNGTNVGSLASLFPVSTHYGRTASAFAGNRFTKEYDLYEDGSIFEGILDAEERNESFSTVNDFQSGIRFTNVGDTIDNIYNSKNIADSTDAEYYLQNPYYVSDLRKGMSVDTIGMMYKPMGFTVFGGRVLHTARFDESIEFELVDAKGLDTNIKRDASKLTGKAKRIVRRKHREDKRNERKEERKNKKNGTTTPKEITPEEIRASIKLNKNKDESVLVHHEVIPRPQIVGYDEGNNIGAIQDEYNDLLAKTNRLFKKGAIRTLISRFNDDKNTEYSLVQTSVSNHGVSRGRNLLKKFEGLGGTDFMNRNLSKYCRVWTMAHQYREYEDAIRGQGLEFTHDAQQTLLESIGQRDVRYWTRYSVLNNNGTVNIAPSKNNADNSVFVTSKSSLKKSCKDELIGGGDANMHKYMFSIENLAWKDSDEFITLLNSSQRGPNGGRIMWFPPYNLQFDEQVTPEWESHSFIGRGEQIYSYKNTMRQGTLKFTMLIDHPSTVDVFVHENKNVYPDEHEMDLLRYFAGCGQLPVEKNTERKKIEVDVECPLPDPKIGEVPEEDVPEVVVPPPLCTLEFYVFFPNNYSGMDYGTEVKDNAKIKYANSEEGGNSYSQDAMAISPIEYLVHGHGTQVTDNGPGYEMSEKPLYSYEKDWDKVDYTKDCYPYAVAYDTRKGMKAWHYRVDYNTVQQNVGVSVESKGKRNNFMDLNSFRLNSDINQVRKISEGIMKNKEKPEDEENPHFLPDKNAYVLTLNDIYNILNSKSLSHKDLADLKELLFNPEIKVRSLSVKGYASSHGNKASNEKLAKNRATTVYNWLKDSALGNLLKDVKPGTEHEIITVSPKSSSVSSEGAKKGRAVRVFMEFESAIKKADNNKPLEIEGANHVINVALTGDEHKHENEALSREEKCTHKTRREYLINLAVAHNEYKYFEDIAKQKSPLFDRIVDKIKYFDPAFHSVTPEGFNARLNFLHQCTRQGPTCSVSDKDGFGAGNLAFGRPPYCVLRIGDFYHTKIMIESVSIDYGDNQWDLNPEGAGVQPMLANVTLGFKFLGGSDIGGPISRLQNAVSFNYYANTSVYDDRAISPLMETLVAEAEEVDLKAKGDEFRAMAKSMGDLIEEDTKAVKAMQEQLSKNASIWGKEEINALKEEIKTNK